MDASVEFLEKNRQYRIVQLDGEYYLLGIEKTIWQIFFPFLFWLMPQEMYKVNTKTVEKLKMPSDRPNNMRSILWIGIGGSAVLSPLVKPIVDFTIETTLLVNILLLIVLAAIIIYLRLYMHHSLQNRLHKTVDVEKLDPVTVKVRPKHIKQFIFPIFGYVFCIFFIILTISLLLEANHFFGLVGFLVFFTLLLITNITVIHPNLGKTNLYRFTLIN